MLKNIKKEISRPASWAYFILVVAMLYIVSENSKSIKDLKAEIDDAITEISMLETLNETTLEAMSNEIAVRDDAIAGWESEAVAVNARLNSSDSLRGELEIQVADLTARLNASASALETSTFALNDAKWRLDDAIANPNCPVAVTE